MPRLPLEPCRSPERRTRHPRRRPSPYRPDARVGFPHRAARHQAIRDDEAHRSQRCATALVLRLPAPTARRGAPTGRAPHFDRVRGTPLEVPRRRFVSVRTGHEVSRGHQGLGVPSRRVPARPTSRTAPQGLNHPNLRPTGAETRLCRPDPHRASRRPSSVRELGPPVPARRCAEILRLNRPAKQSRSRNHRVLPGPGSVCGLGGPMTIPVRAASREAGRLHPRTADARTILNPCTR